MRSSTKLVVVLSFIAATFCVFVVAFGSGVLVGRLATDRFFASPTAASESEPTIASHPIITPTPIKADAEPSPTSSLIQNPKQEERSRDLDYQLIRDVLDLLEQQFYGEIPDNQTLTYGAIRGLLTTLDDPYTSFIEPKAAAILNEDASGEFEGIGATVRMREDGYLEVVRPLPGQPAEAAGILPGDLILSVNNVSIVGMSLYEAISYVRGPAGTEARLEIARPGEPEPIYITVIRARIELPIVEYRMLDNDIAYILLTEFDATAAQRVETALQELIQQSPKGLIFDLRDNPGGYLDQAIKVADIFLGEGVVAIKRDSTGREARYYSFDGDVGEDIPMVVLINGGSASASEIVAGALQDRERAILIGETTLGKGSVQMPNNLRDGSQLRVTIARWYTPNDHNIHNEGLQPDIEVPQPPDTPVDEDPQLDRAVEYLTTGE